MLKRTLSPEISGKIPCVVSLYSTYFLAKYPHSLSHRVHYSSAITQHRYLPRLTLCFAGASRLKDPILRHPPHMCHGHMGLTIKNWVYHPIPDLVGPFFHHKISPLDYEYIYMYIYMGKL